MATYYVDPAGSNTAPYDTWAKAATSVGTIIGYGNSRSGPHIVYIAPGKYAEQIYLNGGNWQGAIFYGVSNISDSGLALKGEVELRHPTTYTLRTGTSHNGLTLYNISITTPLSQLLLYNTGQNTHLVSCYLYDSGPHQLIYSEGLNLICDDCRIEGSSNNIGIQIAGSGSAKFNACVMSNSSKYYSGVQSAIRNTGSGAVELNACFIAGTGAGGDGTISNTGTGSLYAKSCTIASGLNGYVARRAAGTLTIEKSLLVRNFNPPGFNLFSGTVTEIGNTYSAPYVQSHARGGYLFLDVDDLNVEVYDSLNFIAALKPVAKAAGAQINWYIQANTLSGNESAVLGLLEGGTVVLGAHSYSHSNLSLTGNAFAVTSPAGQTISLNRATDTITVTGVGVVSGFKAKTLTAIKAELVALGCTVGASVSGLSDGTLGESLASSSGAVASPYTAQLLIDTTAATGFLYVELNLARSIIEALLGIEIRLLALPYGASSDNVRSAALASGYYTCRESTRGNNSLAACYLNRMSFVSIADLLGADETETRRTIGYIAAWAGQLGANLALLVHSSAEASLENIAIVLDEIKKFKNVSMRSTLEMVELVRTSGLWTTADGVLYTRAEFEDLSDYHLLPTSPCIGAGIDVGLTTDADGLAVPGALGYDIGPYSYMPGWSPFDTLPALALAPTAPGDLRSVQCWSKVATSKEIERY